MKKVGVITFHNSYNCGSMLESYAMQESIKKYCCGNVKIINFSNIGQKELYSYKYKNNSIKNIFKNILLIPNIKKIKNNNLQYENFKNKYFNLTNEISNSKDLDDKDFDVVVSGSDQIWNITIPDFDDAYFLPWVKNAKKVAYAPSFGSKNIAKFSNNIEKYKTFLREYSALSVRENNGQKWIKELINKEVPVLIDPTLILNSVDYDELIAKNINEKQKYIFFYSPSFNRDICKFVKKIADKYGLKVITWSAKSYSTKLVKLFGFELAEYENPESYLYYMKNAELILTTSFHGTIFATMYRKKFFTIKNGQMYGDDDRVKTLLEQIELESQCISYNFDDNFDYMKNIDYSNYEKKVKMLREKAINFLKTNIGDINNENNK